MHMYGYGDALPATSSWLPDNREESTKEMYSLNNLLTLLSADEMACNGGADGWPRAWRFDANAADSRDAS